jgi:SAM-dependent methyltransferase
VTFDPLSDMVSDHYEKWVYPDPIFDLPGWMANNWQWFDPRISHRMFWPDRDYVADIDILIAGCGTNQAAVFAYANPQASVVGIDISRSSLDHHDYLKSHYGLTNLELHQLPIEEVHSLNRDFDLIVSSGVLHHLADPLLGLQSLAGSLRPDGVIGIMLYAKYGRVGVEMLQAVFRDLGLGQDQPSVEIVREVIAALPADHPVTSYLGIASDLHSDAGLVDTFLHRRDRSFTVDDCLDLVTGAGLVFQDWLLKSPYQHPLTSGSQFQTSMSELSQQQQWSVMERINARNACHFFTTCHENRPTQTYRIDFETDAFIDLIPEFRYRCELVDTQLLRHDWTLPLGGVALALVEQVDGERSISDIISRVSDDPSLAGENQSTLSDTSRNVFRSLWNLDFFAMRISNS